PRHAVVDGVPVGVVGKLKPIALSSALAPPGIDVGGVDDAEISVEGVVHEIGNYRAVSLFLVNRRTRGVAGDRNKDERWIYQPQLRVTDPKGKAVFVAKGTEVSQDADGEVVTANLLYRHAQEFATGHGVAAGWEQLADGAGRTTAVF